MVVREHDEDVRVRAHLLHLANDRLAIPRPEARVHDERRLAPDDDADVRDEADVEIRNRPDVLGQLDGRVFPDQRAGRRLLHRREDREACQDGHRLHD